MSSSATKPAQSSAISAPFENPTPKGAKKDFTSPLEDAYEPGRVEASWDAYWEAANLYKPDEESKAEKFTIMLPPPNVTGTLHLGHALTTAIQDAVVRWHRMNGKCVLWLPGIDHAGIATQVVVEKQLAREGLSRHDLSREAFVAKVWEWKEKSGGRIFHQMRTLGSSVDWSRARFTMDDNYAASVLEAFVRMYNSGKIYRANRIVTWSCALRSAISSIEVDYLEVPGSTMVKVPGFPEPVEIGVLHSFAYQVKNPDPNGPTEIVVSTTRIETMLGDVAVAVHPDDDRYKALIGKELVHPFVPERKVVVIADPILVDKNFGTGAVKITPAHDPNDFACGNRHNLPRVNILTDSGYINYNGGQYEGQHRFECRTKIIEDLKALGLYRGKSDNPMAVGICSRSKDIIEPIVRPQWWVDCKDMARRAVEAARNKELTILPPSHEAVWYRWLENIQDWCISRQLWWGHRVPAYYACKEGESFPPVEEEPSRWIIAKSREQAQEILKQRFPEDHASYRLEQDHDVLDTWFSSGLFPFASLGWPNNTTDLANFFPGTLLETGQDILFFWVARMVMMSLELTDKLPFSTVYLHNMVRDRIGRKMSKSLGNVIDPIDIVMGVTLAELQAKLESGNLDPKEVALAKENQAKDFPQGIPTCGADALRFGLLSYTKQGSDINLDPNRIVVARHFCNKLWQAVRFALMHFPADFKAPNTMDDVHASIKAAGGPSIAQAWILSRLHAAVTVCDNAFKNYEFGDATTAIQHFFTDELCARYLELIKSTVKIDASASKEAQLAAESHLAVLFICLDYALRMLHPMMPFVTEELWHRLPCHAERTQYQLNKLAESDPEFKSSELARRIATGSIMIAKYPQPSETADLYSPQAEKDMAAIDEAVAALRSAKNSVQLTKSQKPVVYAVCASSDMLNLITRAAQSIATLSFCETITPVAKAEIDEGKSSVPGGCMTIVVNADLTLFMAIQGLVDLAKELVKTERKYRELKTSQDNLKAFMEGPNYAAVKPEVREKNAVRYEEQERELAQLLDTIKAYSSMVERKPYLTLKIADIKQDLDKAQKNLEKTKASIKPPKDGKEVEIPKKTLEQISSLEGQIAQLSAQIAELNAELATL